MVQPLKIVGKLEKRMKNILERWKREFPDYRVEEIVLSLKIGGILRFGRARLQVTLKRKD